MGRHALLLGSATFHADRALTDLPGVRQDIGQMQAVFEAGGEFDTIDAHVDLPRAEMTRELEQFFGARQSGDLALLYYSGHGLMNDRDRESVFLAAIDTRADQLHTTAVDTDGVLRHLLNITRASHKVVLVDCCFSGAFGARNRFRGGVREEPRRGLRERGTFILTSSNHQRAAKAQGAHQPSLFTEVVLNGLRGEAVIRGDEGWITAQDLSRYVQTEMARRAPAHRPVESSEGVTEAVRLVRAEQQRETGRQAPQARRTTPEDDAFTTDRWRRLLGYYVSCMERSAQLGSFVSLNDRSSYRPMPGGPETVFSGRPVPLPDDIAALARRTMTAGGTLLYGYPVVVLVQQSKPVFTPLLVAGVNVGPDGVPQATLPPRPNVALARQLGLAGPEIDELTQQIEQTFVPGQPEALTETVRQLMRVLDLVPVTPIDPRELTGTVVAGPMRRVQNSAVLYGADDRDIAQRNLLKDLQEMAGQPVKIAETALHALAEPGDESLRDTAGVDAELLLVTPDRLNEAQEQVVRAAMTRRLTVAQGPPGTGKSQLVTALVATATAAGHTVLVGSTNNRAVDEVCQRASATVGAGLIVRSGNRDYQAQEPKLLTELLAAHSGAPAADERTPAAELRIIRDEINRVRSGLDARRVLERDLAELAIERLGTGGAEATDQPDLPDDDDALGRLVRLTERALRHRILGWWARRRLRAYGLRDRQAIGDFAYRVTIELRWRSNRAQVMQLPNEQEGWERLKALTGDRAETSRKLLRVQLARRVREGAGTLRQRSDEMSRPSPRPWQGFRSLLRFLPAWAVTTQSARALVPQPALFDLVIIDEAAQCSVPAVLPMLYRAKRALIIGDPRQLSPVITLPQGEEEAHQAAAGLNGQWLADRRLVFTRHSAFDAFAAVAGDVRLLDEHYRCHPDIVRGPNQQVYQGRLTVLTDQSRLAAPIDPALRWHHVDGKFSHGQAGSGFNEPETIEVVAEVARLRAAYPQASIGVVTPLAAQHRRLVTALAGLSASDDEVVCGTIHRFQGGERDIMVVSPVGAHGIRDSTRNWLVNQTNLWNVAITRARSQLVVVGDRSWWAAQTGLLPAIAAPVTADDAPAPAAPAADALHAALRRAGFQISRDVWLAGYRYDIVATSTEGGGSLAVLVDDPQGEADGRALRKVLARLDVAPAPMPVVRLAAWRCLAEPESVARELRSRLPGPGQR
ncbi:AAA domain-containing protein [Micromonospora sp. CPCC 206060]|uniref:AAA domain-containing protein n=1 Tax=Micromonospora sp. CPCC 206060 TaxID=3122406 RepID=UPI002FF2D390